MTELVTGRYIKGDLAETPVRGYVEFYPARLNGDDSVVLPAPIRLQLDETGAFEVELIATDDPAYEPSGWTWKIREMVPNGDSYNFLLPTGYGPIDISDLIEIDAAPGVFAPLGSLPPGGLLGEALVKNSDDDFDTVWVPLSLAAGSAWFSDAGVPGAGVGIVGSWYVNETNSDVYEKTGAATWTLRGNIGSSATIALTDLTDVTFVSPTTGDVLYFDGTNWVDRALTTADISGLVAALAGKETSGVAATLIASHVGATDPHGDRAYADGAFIPLTQKDVASGVAVLDSGQKVALARLPQGANALLVLDGSGLIPTSALPPLAINTVTVVANQAAMLALTAQRGDMAIRTDNSQTYVLSTDSPSTLADWKQVLAAGQVTSVNGQTGLVVIGISDIAGLQGALDAKAAASHGHAPSDITGTAVITSDARLSDSRTPTAHAASHADGGADEITITESQVTGLTSALAAKVDDSEKGAAGGVATLDGGGKVPAAQIPDIAITTFLGVSANQAAMLALTGQYGDWTTRTDDGKVYVITGTNPTLIGSWTALSYPASASSVSSVNGATGVVVLDAADVGADPVGTAATAVSTHAGEANPHPTYETSAEAAAKITAHEAAGDPHPQYETTAEVAAQITAHAGAADPHTGYQKESEKGAASGYASLDSGGQVPAAQIPAIAITAFLGVVANQAAMLALTGQYGDWCTRSDDGKVYVITGSDPTIIGGWTALTYPASSVVSVNGETGAVSISAADVGAATAAQGATADTAVQPGDLGDSASLDVGTTAGTVAAGDDARFGVGGGGVEFDELQAAFVNGLKNAPVVNNTTSALPTPTAGAGSQISGSSRVVAAAGDAFFTYMSAKMATVTVSSMANSKRQDPANYHTAAGQITDFLNVEFETDSVDFEIVMTAVEGDLAKYRIWIDDEMLFTPYRSLTTDSDVYYQRVQFATAKARRVRVEAQSVVFHGVQMKPIYSLWSTTRQIGPKVLVVTDSYGAGCSWTDTGFTALAAPVWIWDSWPQVLARYTGWNVHSHTVGSQGFVFGPAFSVPAITTDFTEDVVALAPDKVIFALGYNDAANISGLAGVDAAVDAVFDEAVADIPDAEFYVMTAWTPPAISGFSANHTAMDAILAAQAAAHSMTLIDISDWTYGTGDITTPTANGNHDIYASGDRVHPSPAGYEYLGQRAAGALGVNVARRAVPAGTPGATGPAAWAAVSAWTTATVYTATDPKSVVTFGGETYVCNTSHTSAAAFATDVAKWTKIATKGADGAAGAAWGSRVTALTDAATITSDCSTTDIGTVTLTANRALGSPGTGTNGQRLQYRIRQDATGSRQITFNAIFRFTTDIPATLGTTTLSGPNKTDYWLFEYNSTDSKWDCVSVVKGY